MSKQQLINYLQNKLEREEVYLVESHLNDCALCSDAIDGLMEHPEISLNNYVEEIQKTIEAKISIQHPAKQNTKLTAAKGGTQPSVSNKPETLHFFSKYRWQVAASILLFLGLGGYTVLSFIKSHDKTLAKNNDEVSTISETSSTYRPENSSSEITTIQVPPSETEPKDIKTKTVKALTPEAIKEVIAEDAPPPSSAMNLAKSNSPETEEFKTKDVARNPQTQEMREKESNSNIESDYLLDAKPQNVQKIASKKSSNVGLSNSKPASNYNSNQLSYSQDKNNSNSQIETMSANNAEVVLSDYQQGMQYYNAGNFKRSIKYLEDALDEAESNQKDRKSVV